MTSRRRSGPDVIGNPPVSRRRRCRCPTEVAVAIAQWHRLLAGSATTPTPTLPLLTAECCWHEQPGPRAAFWHAGSPMEGAGTEAFPASEPCEEG